MDTRLDGNGYTVRAGLHCNSLGILDKRTKDRLRNPTTRKSSLWEDEEDLLGGGRESPPWGRTRKSTLGEDEEVLLGGRTELVLLGGGGGSPPWGRRRKSSLGEEEEVLLGGGGWKSSLGEEDEVLLGGGGGCPPWGRRRKSSLEVGGGSPSL